MAVKSTFGLKLRLARKHKGIYSIRADNVALQRRPITSYCSFAATSCKERYISHTFKYSPSYGTCGKLIHPTQLQYFLSEEILYLIHPTQLQYFLSEEILYLIHPTQLQYFLSEEFLYLIHSTQLQYFLSEEFLYLIHPTQLQYFLSEEVLY